MRNLLITLLATVMLPLSIQAQWTSHLSLKSCSFVAMTSQGPVAGNSSGFFIYNTTDNLLHSFTKINHLSDIGISAIAADGNNVFVGYQNGNVDIVNVLDYTTINIPEYKNFTGVENKAINGFYRYGSSLFCSTNGGLLQIDISKQEIKSRYQIDFNNLPKINAVTVFRDSLYAATTSGLFRASTQSMMLENNNEWTLCEGLSSNISSVTVFNDSIIASVGSVASANNIFTYANGNAKQRLSVPNFRSMEVDSDNRQLLVATTNMISEYDQYFTQVSSFNIYHFGQELGDVSAYLADAVAYNNKYYIADMNKGLVIADISTATCYCPNAPENNYAYRITANSKGVFCTGGGVNGDYGNLNRNALFHYNIDGQWSTLSLGPRDALEITSDPNDNSRVVFTTWGKGFYRFDASECEIKGHYVTENSPVIDIFGGENYMRTCGIAYDYNSNLFVAQALVIPGIIVREPGGEWHTLSYPIADNLHCVNKLLPTKNGNIWGLVPMGDRTGVFVFNTNNTLDDDSDDMFRCEIDCSGDSRDRGTIHVCDSYGEQITNRIYDIAEDADGLLWLATDQGVLTFNGNNDVFTTPVPAFSRIKVPRNDGTNNADYLLDGINITAIAVDGANRKWIGTLSNGVYLLSADGLETIHAFTTENSPLISDEINSIAIHPTKGEVYFATPLGLVSYKGDAFKPEETLSEIKVWPNPVKPSFTENVKMSGFSSDCNIRITDMNGRIVYSTTSLGGGASWNCKNLDGNRVTTGVYLIWVINDDGTEKMVSKIMVVK